MIYYFTLSLDPSPPFIRLRKSKVQKDDKKMNIKSKEEKRLEHENLILR
jgi:hypothetical protein